mgnify:CR=1 FL=1
MYERNEFHDEENNNRVNMGMNSYQFNNDLHSSNQMGNFTKNFNTNQNQRFNNEENYLNSNNSLRGNNNSSNFIIFYFIYKFRSL